MANGHGGKRTPANPAPVSGPGRLSRRTDGGPTVEMTGGGEYGETKALQELQQAAPTSAPQSPAPSAGQAMGMDLSGIVPLNAPSSRPDEPVTAGAPLGAGPGLEAIGGAPGDPAKADAEALRPYMAALSRMADLPNATPSFKGWVRFVKSKLA